MVRRLLACLLGHLSSQVAQPRPVILAKRVISRVAVRVLTVHPILGRLLVALLGVYVQTAQVTTTLPRLVLIQLMALASLPATLALVVNCPQFRWLPWGLQS
jgi:hypothetical protein